MAIVRIHTVFSRIFFQRCFYLFVSLVVLIAVAPHVTDTLRGRILIARLAGIYPTKRDTSSAGDEETNIDR